MMRIASLLPIVLAVTACWSEPAVLLNAPQQLDGAAVYVDGQVVGKLRSSHNYRWGIFAARQEMAAPPRWEANLAIDQLPRGLHRLRIVKRGYEVYEATFRTRAAHVEVYVPDEAAKPAVG